MPSTLSSRSTSSSRASTRTGARSRKSSSRSACTTIEARPPIDWRTVNSTTVARPQVVFLDVGDTLIRAHPSWAGVYRQGLLEAGIDISEKDLERALLHETQTGAWWNIEDPFEPTEQNSWQRILAFDAAVLERAGHAELPDAVFRKIEEAFARRSAWYVYPDVTPALDALRA